MDIIDDDKFDHLISKALEKEPEFEPSPGFAERVVAMVQSQSLHKESLRDRWWLAGGIVALIGAVVFVLTRVQISEFKPGVGVFTFFSGYAGLILFGSLFVIALHVVDKLLLRKQESG